jgi:hypothetical protein
MIKKYLDLTPAELRALRPLYVPPPTAEDVATWRATREPPTSFNAEYDSETWGHIIVTRPRPPLYNPQEMAVCGTSRAHDPAMASMSGNPSILTTTFATWRPPPTGWRRWAIPGALIVAMCYYRPDLCRKTYSCRDGKYQERTSTLPMNLYQILTQPVAAASGGPPRKSARPTSWP